jgi:hypothetical protein
MPRNTEEEGNQTVKVLFWYLQLREGEKEFGP